MKNRMTMSKTIIFSFLAFQIPIAILYPFAIQVDNSVNELITATVFVEFGLFFISALIGLWHFGPHSKHYYKEMDKLEERLKNRV